MNDKSKKLIKEEGYNIIVATECKRQDINEIALAIKDGEQHLLVISDRWPVITDVFFELIHLIQFVLHASTKECDLLPLGEVTIDILIETSSVSKLYQDVPVTGGGKDE